MKIGYVQISPVFADVRGTIDKLEGMQKAFATADLVVLPELCNSGYNFVDAEQARATAEDARDGPFARYLSSLCKRHNQHIVAGLNEWDAARNALYNTSILVGPDGLVGRYRKLHLFMNEKDIFRPGDLGLPVFDLGVCRLGMLVCFDWIFPEAWRVLALRGADVVCHPANLVLPGLAQTAIPVNALVNRIFIVTANRVGAERDLCYTGESIIADPEGRVLAKASGEQEEVRIVDVDVRAAQNKMVTPRNDVLADRRPKEYADLSKPVA